MVLEILQDFYTIWQYESCFGYFCLQSAAAFECCISRVYRARSQMRPYGPHLTCNIISAITYIFMWSFENSFHRVSTVIKKTTAESAEARLQGSARTDRSEMPATVPTGTDHPERHGIGNVPRQPHPTNFTDTGSWHVLRFKSHVCLDTRQMQAEFLSLSLHFVLRFPCALQVGLPVLKTSRLQC